MIEKLSVISKWLTDDREIILPEWSCIENEEKRAKSRNLEEHHREVEWEEI